MAGGRRKARPGLTVGNGDGAGGGGFCPLLGCSTLWGDATSCPTEGPGAGQAVWLWPFPCRICS